MHMLKWVGFVGLTLMLAACGDDEPASQPATVNKQLAATNAQSTITALSSTLGGDASASAGSLSSVAQGSQNLLQASPSATGTRSLASALTLDDGSLRPMDFTAAGCTCTATSCTFSNCSPGAGASSQYQFTIDGSYSWGGGHVECKNLKYTFKGSGSGASIAFSSDVTVTLNCDITITSTSMKGFLQSAGSSSTNIAGQNTEGAYSASWDVKSTYTDVTFGADHKATGGSLRVEGTTSVTAGGQTQTYAGSADISFPAQ